MIVQILRGCSILPIAFSIVAEKISGRIQYTNPVTYEITQTIAVTNHDVSKLGLLELNLPIPMDWAEQKVRDVQTKGDATFRLRDVDGLGTIVRSLYRGEQKPPDPGESKSLTVTYRLTRKEINTDAGVLAAVAFGPYNQKSNEYRMYTRAEKTIEADSIEFLRIAQELKAGNEHPYRFAKSVYEYVLDHTEYVSPSPSHGARECLLKGQGDCGAYTLLYVGLCRAGGVPARPVVGVWANGENQWHCWAEVQLPGVGWLPVDPSVGDRGLTERAFYFGNLDNNRVALAKTFNLKTDTPRGSTELGFVQIGTWWWYPASASSGSKMEVKHHLSGKPWKP